MKKGQIYEGVIDTVDFPNKSVITVAEEDGGQKKVVVKGGIAGQKVSFSVNKIRKDRCQGRICKVLEKSPLETEEPVCPQFGICGGCNYQTIPYHEQLRLKKNQVLKLIDAVCCSDSGNGMHYIYDGIFPSPEIWGYRNKMEFSFGDEVKGGPLVLGLHKKGSFHDIIDAGCCKLVHGDFNRILACVCDYCRERGIPYYKKSTHQGLLRHLVVRRASSTGEVLAALVVTSQQVLDWSALTDCLRNLPLEGKLTGFLLVTNDSLGDVVQSDRIDILYGRDFFYEEILGLRFRVSLFSFFQTNTKGAEVLYRRVRDYVLRPYDPCLCDGLDGGIMDGNGLSDKVVFDLYSGTGTIAQMLAPVAKKVVGVELVPEAVSAASHNARANGLDNCVFIAGDVLKVLDDVEDKPDVIVLDPPRDGIHPKALRKIGAHIRAKKMVYISCKPTSLSRDLIEFQKYGYQVSRVCCVDMFPETFHVESVVLMSRVEK